MFTISFRLIERNKFISTAVVAAIN